MPAIDPPKIDDATALRVEEARTFSLQGLSARQQGVEITSAVLSVGAAIALAVLADADRPFSLPLAVMFVLAYAAISRVAFNVGAGYVVPTQLVFVPMLLLTPTPAVPLLVMLGTVLAKLGSVLRGQSAPQRMILVITDATFALAPAAVLILLDAQLPDWASWPAYAAAVAAQFAADALRESLRAYLTKVLPVRVMLAEIAEACRLDLLLIPVGLLTALAAAGAPAAALFVLPLVALLQMFARERDARIEQTLELGRSYRGTALLLCDLLEDDDEYTGNHTHDVVELAARVADRLRVPEDVKRETELGAMLHDIGKIGIPDAIINKPGPLDEEEWKLMKTHTLEGQRMLDRVGGFLGSVGEVVRASHERFDGAGYPDGLKGAEIPLAARIVSVCDAFNAMTTTRSYRKAMPVATAVQELRRCSGTQFDPAVVTALLDVIGDPGWALSLRAEPRVATPPARTYSSAP
ncbi:HD-GYP domain-containing protein [Solirubrobacter ginsenosidimutans]|uniref:HD-GYP domain-containing protein n=1 Tax=Solirubrobacter ginsenosidimutans TaxID=490573 RepID=A0A9X3S489_9ACTN|nr:HD-GYP domain-containing protein [Solirubrobacter ginsenosidimutans]MDA0162886.1 HD-GYP domain-containing protein [Solirubrobacter ginsenosidimutans]